MTLTSSRVGLPHKSKLKDQSPGRIKEFLKLFKNSNSNTRILKVSPYCNSSLKSKIMHALEGTRKKESLILRKPRREDRNLDQRGEALGRQHTSENLAVGPDRFRHLGQTVQVRELASPIIPFFIKHILVDICGSTLKI